MKLEAGIWVAFGLVIVKGMGVARRTTAVWMRGLLLWWAWGAREHTSLSLKS